MDVNDLRSQIIFFVIFVDEYKISAFYPNFQDQTQPGQNLVSRSVEFFPPPPGPPPLNNSKAGQEGGYIPLRKP